MMLWVWAAWGVTIDCVANPCPKIEVILAENLGAEELNIYLAPGVYTDELDVTDRAVSLRGVGAIFAGSSATATPGRTAQIVVSNGARLSLEGVTIAPVNLRGVLVVTGSQAELIDVVVAPVGAGSGLRVEGATATVTDSLFVDGVTLRGAHVAISNGDVQVVDSDFIGGTAANQGGAIYGAGSGSLTVEGCTFSGNRAGLGGAISVEGMPLTVSRSEFVANSADEGGAIETRGAPVSIHETVFEENLGSVRGGAVAASTHPLAVTRSTFCKNTTDGSGGAVDAGLAAESMFRNCRFLDNVSARGGGLAFTGDATSCSFLGNRASVAGAAVQGPTDGAPARLEFASIGWSAGSVAVAGMVFMTDSNAWRSEVSDFGLAVDLNGVTGSDPRLRGYSVGQACGLVNDFHHPDGALQHGRRVIGSLKVSTNTQHGDDHEADFGAYGGRFSERAPWRDADEDGWVALYDCDDGNPTIFPDAPNERYGDGIDQNCDGRSDYDEDRDGFDSVDSGGTDCNDQRPDIHPNAFDLSPTEDLNCDGRIRSVPYELIPDTGRCQAGSGPVGLAGWFLLPIAAMLGRRRRVS